MGWSAYPGTVLIILFFSCFGAALIQGWRLFRGGAYLSKYGMQKTVRCDDDVITFHIWKTQVDVFFFLFLDERNNQVRVTNCQSPLSPTCADSNSLVTARQAMEVQIFYFCSLWPVVMTPVPCQWEKHSVAKKLSAILCTLCLAVQLQVCLYCHFHLRHFILSLIMLVIACNSFFFCSEIESRTSNCMFFPQSQSQSSALFIWRKMEVWFVMR